METIKIQDTSENNNNLKIDSVVSEDEKDNKNDDKPETESEPIVKNEEEAIALKTEANGFFKIHNYDKAITLYTESIEKHPDPVPAAFYSNRSFAYLKNDCPAAALKDAEDCIKSDEERTSVSLRSVCTQEWHFNKMIVKTLCKK